MKQFTILILFLFISIQGISQESKKNYEDAFKLIEVWLEAQKDFEGIPGMIAMVIDDQEIAWAGAFGKANIEQNKNINLSSICSICSITKSFTAVAIMKLVDEGKLHLEDEVKDLLPFYKVQQNFPKGGAITIGSLLSHSSGLPGNTIHSYFSGPEFNFPSQNEFRSIIKDLETESEVGSDVSYSNIGYALLGEIIEKVTGMPYETYLMNEVLLPLKMNNTFIGSNSIIDKNKQASGYTAINRNRNRNNVNLFETEAMTPAMGLWTSISDLGKYASWQFRLQDANTTEVLKSATLKTMHQAKVTSKDGYSTWGLGFEVIKSSNGDDWVSHGGTCPGFVSLLQLNLSTKMAVVIMVNANRVATFKYSNGIKQILERTKLTIEKPENDCRLEDYTGYYDMNPWNSEVYISSWGEDLVVLQLPENSPKRGMQFYKYLEKDTFIQIKENGELGAKFVFERDRSGKVYRYKEGGNYKNKMSN